MKVTSRKSWLSKLPEVEARHLRQLLRQSLFLLREAWGAKVFFYVMYDWMMVCVLFYA
jgi:hypothetical protein